jgi:hypothetical protein
LCLSCGLVAIQPAYARPPQGARGPSLDHKAQEIAADDSDIVGAWRTTYSPLASIVLSQVIEFRSDHTLTLYKQCPEIGEVLPATGNWVLRQGVLKIRYGAGSQDGFASKVVISDDKLIANSLASYAERISLVRYQGVLPPACTSTGQAFGFNLGKIDAALGELGEPAAWKAIRQSSWLAPFEAYLDRFPNGPHGLQARRRILAINAYLAKHPSRPSFFPLEPGFPGGPQRPIVATTLPATSSEGNAQ